ncbi:ZP domain-containing protein-like [Clavelina lepadiformis]|uniref:ZP domain-containing protein-like n=1 Tax=Clavelina lepadiformis TaxID=159417 RepID=UPI004041BA11
MTNAKMLNKSTCFFFKCLSNRIATFSVKMGKPLFYAILFCFLFQYHITCSQVVIVGNQFTEELTIRQLEEELMFPGTVNIRCTPNKMCITLSKEWLTVRWGVKRADELSLGSPCKLEAQENDTHVMLCTEGQQLSSCGTQFVVNDTHVVFTNNVTLKESDESNDFGVIGASRYRRVFPWRCIYPTRIFVGIDFIPEISPITLFLGKKTGEGQFRAAMFLYKDDNYTSRYQNSPQMKMSDKLRVRVALLQGPPFTKMQVVRCWATPDNDPLGKAARYGLIRNHCPVSRTVQVAVISNGEYEYSTWESNVFKFVDFPNVYLHCNVKVCFDGPNCLRTCNQSGPYRKRRDLSNDVVVSVGPIWPDENVPAVLNDQDQMMKVAVTDATTASVPVETRTEFIFGMPKAAVFTIAAVIIITTIAFIISTAACVVRKKRTSKRLTISSKSYDPSSSNAVQARSVVINSEFQLPVDSSR